MAETGAIRMWLLALIPALALGFGALVGIGCALGANACPFGADEPFTSTVGSEIWTAQCALCHGVDASGSDRNPRAPSLVTGAAASRSLEELIAEIESGSPGLMPRFEGKLTDEQIASVARYVIELREGTDE
ncbi:MAG TPA: cytochrome c [Actinomycetota bacterium]